MPTIKVNNNNGVRWTTEEMLEIEKIKERLDRIENALLSAQKKRTYPEEKMLDWLTSNVSDKNVGDTIFRQDAIDAINHICPVDTEYDCTLLDRVDVRYVLSELPSTQSERKRGRWVGFDGNWFKTMCMCSECGAMIDINEKYKNFFCYHCGARMDGE